MIALLAIGCAPYLPGSPPSSTDTDQPLPPPTPEPWAPPHWDPGPCGVRALPGGIHGVDRCRAWVSAGANEGFGYRVRAGELASGPHVAAGGIGPLRDARIPTGIRLLESDGVGLFEAASHTWLREIGTAGNFGIAFDFVGAVGPTEEPVIADLDNGGLFLLREPATTPETLTQDHEDLLFPMEESVVYTDRCGDVTGNGHADLCHRGYATRVYEGPVTPDSEPWMTLTGPGGNQSPYGTFGRFGSDGPAVVFGMFWYDSFRGGLGYLPLAQGEHELQPSNVRFVGAAESDHTNDGIGTGDFDGDGDLELVLAESFADEQRGKIRVLNDTPNDVFGEVLVELAGREPYGRFGTASLVADLNGDGHPDLVVAAQGTGSFILGRIHIFPGPVEQMSWDTAITWSTGAQHYDAFGWSLAVFDEDGDGDLELFVGAPRFSEVAPGAGAVFSIDDPLPTGP